MKTAMLVTVITLMSFSAVSASTANLVLKGTVPAIYDLKLVSETISSTLRLDQTQNDLKVATVTETSNAKNGYKVSISSDNKGQLVRVGGSEKFGYQLKYDNQQITLSGNAVEVRNSNPELTGRIRPVTISYTGVPSAQMISGEYTDNVVFTIAAN